MKKTTVQRQRGFDGTWHPVILVKGLVFAPEEQTRMTRQEAEKHILILKSSLGSCEVGLLKGDPDENGKPHIKIVVPVNGTKQTFVTAVNSQRMDRTFELLARQLGIQTQPAL
jgi:hypothetical protein